MKPNDANRKLPTAERAFRVFLIATKEAGRRLSCQPLLPQPGLSDEDVPRAPDLRGSQHGSPPLARAELGAT
jgi:hypothetical protein